jgi:hypothetical protein
MHAADIISGSERRQAAWQHSSHLRIGEVSLALRGDSADEVRLGRDLDKFRCERNDPDIEVNVEWVDTLQGWQSQKRFDSGAVWTVFRAGDEFVFDFSSSAIGTNPYKRLLVDSGFWSATLLLNREVLQRHRPVRPLEYPADELLFTNYLASGLGVEVHGCGLVDSETGGHLFLGHSGAGKSTTTMLWKSLRNPQILSDDRIILRMHDGELWMYGTPWHGEAAFAMAGSAPIRRIFIIEHGGQDEITPLNRSRAVGELFARSFPPFHNAHGLERVVGFLDQVLDTVPCYQFQFVPDARAVEKVVEFHD